MLVSLIAKNIADFIEIELRRIAHAALPPPQEALEAAHLTEQLSGLAHSHALRTVERVLVHKLFELLHLVHHVAQMLKLLLRKGIEILQKVVEIVDGGIE